MKKFISSCILISFLLVSCTSTRIVSSWKEPNKQVQINKLSKVLVIALFKSETNRRKAEDQMVGYLNGKGVVSYNYLDADFNKNKIETLRDKIKADGFDGVVTMSLMDVDREKLYVPGNYELYPTNYRTLNGYYARGWANYSTPGYYETTKTFTVETNIFSVKENKIIWTGQTQTTDPNGVTQMTEEIARVIYKKMLSEGFITHS